MKKLIIPLFLALFGPFLAHAAAPPEPVFAHDRLVIESNRAHLLFDIEIAKTMPQKEYGLMHRKTLPAHQGMLFLWPKDSKVEMWMKDTPLSLDMLFIDSTGQIVYIAPSAKPESTDTIAAPEPVRAVLEVAAGTAKSMNIRTGDRVMYSAFKARPK